MLHIILANIIMQFNINIKSCKFNNVSFPLTAILPMSPIPY